MNNYKLKNTKTYKKKVLCQKREQSYLNEKKLLKTFGSLIAKPSINVKKKCGNNLKDELTN